MFFFPSTQEQREKNLPFSVIADLFYSPRKSELETGRGLVWQLYPLGLGRGRAAGHLPEPGPVNLEPGKLPVTGSALRCSAGMNQHLQREETRLSNPALLGRAAAFPRPGSLSRNCFWESQHESSKAYLGSTDC